MKTSPHILFKLSRFWLPLLCVPAMCQQGAVSFKHFRTYPSGEWAQELQAYRSGRPAGPLQRSTTCSSPLTPSQAALVKNLGNAAAPMCSIKVLKDEERTAEYEQVCTIGSQEQVIHSTLRAIDDRTMETEIRHAISGTEVSFARITNRYQGPCTAGQAAPTIPMIPARPKPSAEQCAGVAEMKQQAADGLRGCSSSDTPEADRASCVAAMKRLSSTVQQMEAQCK